MKTKITLIAIVIILVAGLFKQRHSIACEIVSATTYKKIAPNIFASPEIKNTTEILRSISNAKQRVNSVFGEMVSNPKIVLVSNSGEAKRLGANNTATTLMYSPLGTCVVLGPDGQNVDVSAHELTHAEIVHRIGQLRHLLTIPVWFNEGVALIVDYREPFLVDNIKLTADEIEAVRQLDMGHEFFGGKDPHKNYLASRLAVQHVDPKTLYKKLQDIRNGANFEYVFERNN